MLKKIAQVAGVFLGFLVWDLAAASSILISPVDPVIESNQQVTAIWLQNQGNAPVVLQIRALSWQQMQLKDDYQEAQQSLIVSPPMATIPPGKRQLVRLLRGQMMVPGYEGAFRLLIDEIPPAVSDASAVNGKNSVGLQFQMRYSVPLFVAGEGVRLKDDAEKKILATIPKLSAKLVTTAGKKYLQIHNEGKIHARLSKVVWRQGVKNSVLSAGLLGYVLPGAQMQWPVSANVGAGGALTAQVNDLHEVPIPLL